MSKKGSFLWIFSSTIGYVISYLFYLHCRPGEGRGGWAPPRTCRGGARARAAWWSGCCSCSPPSPPATHTNIFAGIQIFLQTSKYFIDSAEIFYNHNILSVSESKKNVSCKNFDRLIFHEKGQWKRHFPSDEQKPDRNFHKSSWYFLCRDEEQISWWLHHCDIMWISLTLPTKSRKWIFRASYLSIESTIALKISVLTSSMSSPTVCRPVRNFFRHSLNRCFFLPSFLKKTEKSQFSLNFPSHGICSDLWWDFVNNVLVITNPGGHISHKWAFVLV